MRSTFLFLAAMALTPLQAAAEAVPYKLDASHSQIVFSYNHLGFSTTYNMFSGFEGDIMFDAENPAESSVSVAIPVKSLFTGWEARFEHFMSEQFFGATDEDLMTFVSTAIEVTGEETAIITGDLTINGVTKSVDLDAKLNASGNHPRSQKPWLGFDATTTLLRSDYNLGLAAPAVSDELEVSISIEAGAEG